MQTFFTYFQGHDDLHLIQARSLLDTVKDNNVVSGMRTGW